MIVATILPYSDTMASSMQTTHTHAALHRPFSAPHRTLIRRQSHHQQHTAPMASRSLTPTDHPPTPTVDSHPHPSRRSSLFLLLASTSTALAAQFVFPNRADAFGSGFPGYDVNMDARKRAQARIKAEMDADLARAAAYRAKLKADKENGKSASSSSGSATVPTTDTS